MKQFPGSIAAEIYGQYVESKQILQEGRMGSEVNQTYDNIAFDILDDIGRDRRFSWEPPNRNWSQLIRFIADRHDIYAVGGYLDRYDSFAVNGIMKRICDDYELSCDTWSDLIDSLLQTRHSASDIVREIAGSLASADQTMHRF